MSFTTENTVGYTTEELAELNRLLEIELTNVSPDDELYHELVQAASERVLAAFVPPGA